MAFGQTGAGEHDYNRFGQAGGRVIRVLAFIPALLPVLLTTFLSSSARVSAAAAIFPLMVAASPTDDALRALRSAPGYLGVVVSRNEVNVAPEVSGLLASIDVELGDRVRRGQLLFRIEDNQLRHEVAIAGAAVQSAQANVVRARVARDEARRRNQRRQDAGEAFSSEDRELANTEAEAAQAELQFADADLVARNAQLALLKVNLQRTRVRALFDVHVTFVDRLQPVSAWIIGVSPEVDPAIEMILVEASLAAGDSAVANIRVGMVGKVNR